MKNLIFFQFIASLLLSSCNDNIFDNLKTEIVNENIPTSLCPKWKEHIEYAQRNKDTKLEAGSNEVSLIGYTYRGKNIYGGYVWIYHIHRSSFFNGKGILVSRSNIATHDSAIGWSCDARLETIGGTIDESKYDEFAWGYSYGRNMDVTLSWNGTGFTIPSGSTGTSGSLVHRR